MIKKLALGVVASSMLLGFGVGDLGGASKAEAAVPVEASISPKNVSRTGSSTSVTKTLSWGGGTGSSYHVYYNDGKYAAIDDPYSSYRTTNTSSYSISSSTTSKTWNDFLRVTGSKVATDSGTIKLSR